MSSLSEPGSATGGVSLTSPAHPLLLFFDGECAFCDRWVGRIKEADRGHRTRFATKQGATFQRVARLRPELAQVDSIVLAARRSDGGEDFLVRTAAVRRLIEGLPGFGVFAFVLRVVPVGISDLGYRLMAKVRTRIYGRLEECRVPLPEERELYLD